jgi:hypothetical protein
MKISINGTAYAVPSSLKEITLADRIAYDKAHGKSLRAQLKKIAEIKDLKVQELELSMYGMDMACRTLSHFGKIPLATVQDTSIDDVFAVYSTTMKLMSEEVNFSDPDARITHEVEWEGDTWEIQPVELKQESKMRFGEFIDAKNIVQSLYELADEKWEALLMLCCIFFRKKGEKYTRQLSEEGGERYKLMEKLPLEYGFQVGFFLINSLSSYQHIFPYSTPAEPKELAKT